MLDVEAKYSYFRGRIDFTHYDRRFGGLAAGLTNLATELGHSTVSFQSQFELSLGDQRV